MRMLLTAVALLLGVVMTIRAQSQQPALQGLPEYGVTLSGSPDNPVVENHSGKTIIGYVFETADQNGRASSYHQLLVQSAQATGIPDGGSLYAIGTPVNSNVPNAGRVRRDGQSIVRATLQNVIFADGQFVGVDEHGVFERLSMDVKATTEVGILAKIHAWDQVEAFAQLPLGPPHGGEALLLNSYRRMVAPILVGVRRTKGEAAAAQLAELYSSLPTLWK
jgi:hypothetical protein